MITALLGIVVGGFLVALVFGLVTGRIDWRQQGCCAANPDEDLRLRTPDRTTT